MARSRRPRRAGPDERGPQGTLGTLGTLVRSTLAQAGVVRDVLERGAREGRARLEEVRRDRARGDALADLGQAVLELLEAGQFPELLEQPAVADAVAALDGDEAPPAWTPTRRGPRYDRDDAPARAPAGRPARGEDDGAGTVSSRTWRPPASTRGGGDDDDGTVSSRTWRPPAPTRAAPVWRPPVEPTAAEREGDAAPAPREPARPPRPGGIQFGAVEDDDDDLAEYMHPDDVPPRDRP
ncbi:MAG: hypothetical protein IPL61_04840 [Myxococcales bacterium]|nr:hypothetical protein [Myxococcales bacterium]